MWSLEGLGGDLHWYLLVCWFSTLDKIAMLLQVWSREFGNLPTVLGRWVRAGDCFLLAYETSLKKDSVLFFSYQLVIPRSTVKGTSRL